MVRVLVVSILALTTLTLAIVSTPTTATTPFPSLPPANVTTYVVDLDSPAEQHFQAIVADHKEELSALLAFLTKAIPPKLLPLAEKVAADLDFAFGPTVAAELRGIAESADFELGQIVLLNVLYELTAFCTSILAVEPDGTLLHARNLDYGLPHDLQEVTVQVSFVRSGKPVFTATTFAGFAGVLTGMSPVFSVTVDEWNTGAAWENAFSGLLEGGKAVTFVIRELLEDPNMTYAQAAHTLATQHLIAPSFLTVGGIGANETAIITRNRMNAENITTLETVAHTDHPFAIVITNYPTNQPDPPSDPRRTFALHHLEAITGPDLDPSSLLSVISTPPVLNKGTVYSILACVQTQQYLTYLR